MYEIRQYKKVLIIGLTIASVAFGALYITSSDSVDSQTNSNRLSKLIDEPLSVSSSIRTARNNSQKTLEGEEWGALKRLGKVSKDKKPVKKVAKKEDSKKKKDKKKKKKKKKKKDKDDDEYIEIVRDEPAPKKNDSYSPPSSFSGTTLFARNKAAKDGIMDTVEEWLAYLTANPELQKTEKFINAFRVQEIISEIFYPVILEMSDDEDELVRRHAILALSSIPSTDSLVTSAEIKITTKYEDTAKKADSAMGTYTSSKYIDTLVDSISMGSSGAQVETIKLTVHSARRNIGPIVRRLEEPSDDPSEAETEGQSEQASTSNQNRELDDRLLKTYTDLASYLASISQNANDSGVRSQAASASQQIQSLLSSVHSPVQSTVQGPDIASAE